jgi:hypothetical protein
VGIPALVMTPARSFVGFTDGERGIVIIQALDADGSPTTDPVELRATTRELYGDSPFLDAGVAAAAIGEHGLIVANDGTDLWRATSAGPGQPWVEESWWTVAADSPPRLATIEGRVVALTTIFGGSGIQINAESSADGGRTWDYGATWHDPSAGDASMAVAPDQTTVLWEGCDRFCTGSIVRLGDVEASNGRWSRIDGPAGRPTGALLTADSMVVAWIEEGPDYRAEQRTVVVATGPRP